MDDGRAKDGVEIVLIGQGDAVPTPNPVPTTAIVAREATRKAMVFPFAIFVSFPRFVQTLAKRWANRLIWICYIRHK